MLATKKKLNELLLLYDLEPELRDIYVEGDFDNAIIRWFLDEKDHKDVSVYSISSINIPASILIDLGRKDNNRERVLYLAEFLYEKCEHNIGKVTCILDLDFSCFLSQCVKIPNLLYTDYSCMEMYFIDLEIMEKFFKVYCYKTDWPYQTILNSISSLLQRLFLFRLADEDLNWNIGVPGKFRDVTIKNWHLVLNEENYIRRFLNKKGKMSEVEIFYENVNAHKKKLKLDPRHQIHGHDFTKLLCWFLHKKGVEHKLSQPEIVIRVLVGCATVAKLEKYNLFSMMLKRLK